MDHLYSEADLALARRLADEHLAQGHGNRRQWFASTQQGWVFSKLAEWAVADSLGVPRNEAPEDFRTADVLLGQTRIGVRYRSRADGDLMSPSDQAVHVDWQVLVVPGGPSTLRIVGAASREELLEAGLQDFGYGPTRVVRQSELRPWSPLRAALLGR